VTTISKVISKATTFKVKCLWVRKRGRANKADILLGVCYRPLNQDEEVDETF